MEFKNLLEMDKTLIRRNNLRNKKEDLLDEEIKKLKEKTEKQIKVLENTKDKIKYTHIQDILKPIAEEIKNKLGVESYEWYGGFGMCSENSIYWKKKKDESITKKGNVKGSITFISYGDGWAIRTRNKIKNPYPSNSIAEMNGMNYKTLEFNEKMDFNWLFKYIKRER